MTTWNFQFRLNRTPTDDEIDALFEAGLDDAAVSGDVLDVDRESPHLIEAVASALADVRKVPGLRPVGIVTDDEVTLGDAAQRLGNRTAESLRLLASGERGPGGFPAPLVDTGNVRVYSYAEITGWLREELGEDVPEPPADVQLLRVVGQLMRTLIEVYQLDEVEAEAVRSLLAAVA